MKTNKPEVKRYEWHHDVELMIEDEGGEFVRFDDYEALQAESALLRAAIRRLCNIYVVDDYYMGQLREERLEAAVNRAIEQVKETTHENQ